MGCCCRLLLATCWRGETSPYTLNATFDQLGSIACGTACSEDALSSELHILHQRPPPAGRVVTVRASALSNLCACLDPLSGAY